MSRTENSFWKNLELFEIGEYKNDSKDILLREARRAARMTAYEKLIMNLN